MDNINGSSIYAKLEYFNPMSLSVKDRPATYMLEGAIKRGEVTSDVVFIEASSGNLGIAYGKAVRFLGLRAIIVIPSIVGEETYRRLKDSGATVERTPDGYCPRRDERDGALVRVKDMFLETPNRIWLNQYSNPDNIRAHEEGTGPEIWEQTKGRVKKIALGAGTGGSIVGITRCLKKQNPDIESVIVTPQKNHHIHGLRNFEESLEPQIIRSNKDLFDDRMKVSDQNALETTKYLWRKGYPVGTSSGLNYFAAREIAKEKRCSFIVTLFPDVWYNSFKLMQNYVVERQSAI